MSEENPIQNDKKSRSVVTHSRKVTAIHSGYGSVVLQTHEGRVVAMATLDDTSLYALDEGSRIWLLDLCAAECARLTSTPERVVCS